MRIKSYFLAVSLCCMLPFMAQGVDLDPNEPKPPIRAQLTSISPIVVDTDFSMLTLYFISDLGEVQVVLQPIAGKREYSQSVDTSMQNQAVLAAPAGTYILTITDTDWNVIQQESVVIP